MATKHRSPKSSNRGRRFLPLRRLHGAVEQLENSEPEDLRAELSARFALMSGEVKRLFVVLEAALKLSKAEA